jgi:hypothetical protein
VRTVVQPPEDLARGLRVLMPSGRSIVGLAVELSHGVSPCAPSAAAALLSVLAPRLGTPPPDLLTTEGF